MASASQPLAAILPFLRCPLCTSTPLAATPSGLACTRCNAHFPIRDRILDMLGEVRDEVITPFQRLMQAAPVVSVYEKIWRRTGYYLASSRSFGREIETVLRHAHGREDARLMDLACGPGVFTRPLARQAKGLVVGFDLSRPMLRHAGRMIEREGLSNVILIRGTVFHMPFIEGSFTYVNCCGALHLFDRPDDALVEVERVLAPGGGFCVQTTIRPAHSGGAAYFLEKFIRFGFFEERDLLARIDRHGFEILNSERHRISFTFAARRR